MSYFWTGFLKRAEAGTAGSGFSGTGKGNLPTGYGMQGQQEGPVGAYGSSVEDTRTDKQLLDRQRNPKDYSLFSHGQDGPADANPHIIY